jgi:L-amino acid N-acyltransferase YncA/N-acetylglutamate synthase-like GNAT family acetyltransferase
VSASPGAIVVDVATAGDVPAMLALSNWAASATPANFATEPETVTDWLDAWRETSSAYPWLVARQESDAPQRAPARIAGFAKASPHRARGAYQWTAEVSVYVDPSGHNLGVGKRLYRHLVPVLRRQGYVTLLAGITPPNPASERLHAALGFRPCGTYHRAGFKFGKWHDVGYWELHLWPRHLPPSAIRPVAAVWPGVRDGLNGTTRAEVRQVDLVSEVAQGLIRSLDAELLDVYPEPGATHFDLETSEVAPERGGFFIIEAGETTVGCGALRALDAEIAELKRMYVVPEWRGLGFSKTILDQLERAASRIGMKRVRLETGERQVAAIALYERSGYRRIAPFGAYVDSPLSVCMEKTLSASQR